MSDTAAGLLQVGLLIVLLAACYRPLGGYMARVYMGEKHSRVERGAYKLFGVDAKAEQTWAAERVENALLRERINDIAAEIARLTAALEGADSPIEAMLMIEPAPSHESGNGPRPANGERKPAPAGGEGKGNLADRIRALQLKASRLPAAG